MVLLDPIFWKWEISGSSVSSFFCNSTTKYNVINRALLVHLLQNISTKNSGNRQKQKTKHLMGSKPFSQISFEQVMTTLTKLITYLNIWSLPNATLYCCHLRETRLMVNNLLIWNFGWRLTPRRGNGQMTTLGMSTWVLVYDCSFKITTCFKLILELFEITWS